MFKKFSITFLLRISTSVMMLDSVFPRQNDLFSILTYFPSQMEQRRESTKKKEKFTQKREKWDDWNDFV